MAMRPSPGGPVGEFEELRGLLLSREHEQLRDLRTRLADKEQRARDVAGVLPEAVKLSRERGEELAHALRPAVESSIKESIEKRPENFIDALHPIIGPMVRRSIAESLRRLMQSLNQTLEHTFSWQGLKWRFEALRTGKSFAEVVMLRSLIFRVEQLFLIHRETSLSLLHVTANSAIAKDSDMVAGMLSAIQDFARDSFEPGEDAALEEFRIGELQVWIAPGRHAYLAAVIRGEPPRDFRFQLEEAIDSIHTLNGSALARFQGDAAIFESLRPDLETCLRAQYSTSRGRSGRQARAWVAVAVVVSIAIGALALAARSESKWKDFLGRLKAQPGIAVTEARKGWLSPSQVTGLRDRSSADPAAIARAAKVDPATIRFDWKDYLALDARSVRERFEQRFGIPTGAQVTINNGLLTLAGQVPYEWLEIVRREATLMPGITSVDDPEAQVIYDPGSVLKRFEEKFSFPETVNGVLTGNVLTLSGEASHRWLERVRSEAAGMPGIGSIDDHGVTDLDERTFQQSKSIIENAFIYFLLNKDDIATEGFAALSRLPDQIRSCATAAKRLGLEFSIEIDGYADSVGEEALNIDLSQRRANKVRDFLTACGFDAAMLKPTGKGPPLKPAAGDKALPDQAQRRVAFKILSQRSAVAR